MQKNHFVFSEVGHFLLQRIFINATVASYRPMLSKMDGLLFGEAQAVFDRGISDDEAHVDRMLNVLGSGFQHEKYFAELDDIILSIFNEQPYEKQPKYVADMD